ncbi:MAG: replication factor C large subunit [Candidatus Diapherotrites archaeon]
MFAQKYTPQSLSQMIGNPEVITEIRLWAQGWKQGMVSRPLLLVGPPGVGKTLSAYTVAREFDFSLVEFNASDTRDKETIEKVVSAAATNASFSGNPRLVLLDEVDGLQGRMDRGGLSAILSVLKEAKNPIILTANDIYSDSKLAGIRTFCKMLSFRKIPYPSIAKRLREIGDAENIDYDALSVTELAKNSSGDMRAALLDFDMVTHSTKKITLEDVQQSGYRERSENVFTVIRSVFTSPSFNDIRRAHSSVEVDDSLFKKWIEENIPRQFPMIRSLASAFNALSRSDVFDGRIYKRQHYGFLKYSGDIAASVGLHTSDRAHGFISYQFPSILKRLSVQKGSSKRSVVEKIQSHVHGSRSRITQELVYYSILLADEKNAPHWISLFGFEAEDVAFLLQTTPSSVRVKRLMKDAVVLRARPRSSISPLSEELLSVDKLSKSETVSSSPSDEKESHNQTSLSSFFN